MPVKINPGECVQMPDGRVGRVREVGKDNNIRVRVKRLTSKGHQFIYVRNKEIRKINCPKGWMSPEGYNHYVKITFQKLKKRMKAKKI